MALGVMRYPAALETLVKLCHDPSWSIRRAAVFSLGLLGDCSAEPALLGVLKSRPLPIAGKEEARLAAATRAAAALGLARVGAASAVDALINALSDRFALVRARAADALGILGERAALSRLSSALQCDKDAFVRGRAAAALGRLDAHQGIPWLVAALEDDNSYVRSRAAASLGYLGAELAATPLAALMAKATEDEVLCKASVALCRLAKAVPREVLCQAIRHVGRLAVQRFPDRAPAIMQMALCHVFASHQPPKIESVLQILEVEYDLPKKLALPYQLSMRFVTSGRNEMVLTPYLPAIQEAARGLAEGFSGVANSG